MSNANRDYAIVYDVKNSLLVLSRPLNFYLTDKNTSNIFVRLVTKVSVGNGIDQYTDIENATNYVLTMRVIKPDDEVKSLTATQHESESIFQFDLTEDFKDIPGKYICELTISNVVNGRQEFTTSDPFNYEVKRSILSNVKSIIEGKDTTVEKLLNRVDCAIALVNGKPNKNEVFLVQDGININDFDEATRRTFLEAQGIDVNYVLGDKAVKHNNLADNSVKYNHLSPGTPPLFLAGVNMYENLLGASLFTEGSLYADGTVNTVNTNYYVSHYIGINPGKTYYRWNTDRTVVVAYYDADKTFISRPTIESGTISFVAPSNAYYMRYTDAKEKMMNEIISSIPITKHHNYVGSIYEFDKHYALSDNTVGTEKIKSKAITRNLLADRILGVPDFLAEGSDLNTLSKDGYFVCANCTNKPNGMGTCFLLNRVFLNETDEARWAIQEIVDFTDPSNRYIRITDLKQPTNNKAWTKLSKAKSKFEGKKLITIGDSITEGVGASNSNTTYPAYLKNKYGLNVVNTGIAGATWANYNDGYDDISIIHQVDNTNFSDADFVTIFAGTNDFGRQNGDTIGNTTDTGKNTVKGAMNYVIGKILTQNPNVKIAIITPMWRQRIVAGDNKDSDTNALGGQYLIDYVKAIEEQAKYNHIPCLNLYETCLINKHNYSTYLSDGLHPNDKGYELLADKIHSFLESVY